MSYASEIKEIICQTQYECPACRLAEIAGYFAFRGKVGEGEFRLSTTIPAVSKRMVKAIEDELGIVPKKAGKSYVISGDDFTKFVTEITGDIFLYECCKVAYIRGAFLGGGSVNSPEKKYHLEFSTRFWNMAENLVSILKEFDFKPRQTLRNDKALVYMKEGGQISDILGYITGGRAGLEFVEAQVEKEYSSATQRLVNCDNANLNKVATASSRHRIAIKKIKAAHRWQKLPEVLREIGELRIKHPEASLEDLGKMTEPPIGKSGVNHRLNRIVEYAEGLGKD